MNEFIARNGLKALADSTILGGLSATTLFISATTNPVRIQGLSASTDTLYLTVDATGVMHTGTGGSSPTPYTTAFTYNNANTLTLTNNTGGTLSASINTMTGLTVNGFHVATSISATSVTAVTLSSTSITVNGITYTAVQQTLKYYAEYSGTPTAVPSATGSKSIALGDSARALGADMFVYGNQAGAGTTTTAATAGVFMGPGAGASANNAANSNFLGNNSGQLGTNAHDSNFFGNSAGYNSANASYSNFFGYLAGYTTTNASQSNFFGTQAGYLSAGASYSNFLGQNAGYSAASASQSNFFGWQAGQNATNASSSNFFGTNAGFAQSGASISNFFGYNVGSNASGYLGSNNIIIGTNISLTSGTANAINIGGVLFGTGTYATTTGAPFTGNTNGKIGINVVGPTHTLHISAATDPVRIQGLASGSDTLYLTVDASGVVHTGAGGTGGTSGTTLKYYAEYSGAPATSPTATGSRSIAIGDSARALAADNFMVGFQAGTSATGVTQSVFIGLQAGYQAINSPYSIFIGPTAGYQASAVTAGNFFGSSAGYQAYNANYSNFYGQNAGKTATNADHSNFFGINAGNAATSAYYSNFFGSSAGNGAVNANNSNLFGQDAGNGATNANNSNFFGNGAGYGATGASYSNFFGYQAGYQTTAATYSNFMGYGAGYQAYNASNGNFYGNSAGQNATNAHDSNFFGSGAGSGALSASYSNVFGYNAGNGATGASFSNFFGYQAGYQAYNASSSFFVGNGAGQSTSAASYSVLIGLNAGANYNSTAGIGTNNIIIGQNITLADNTTNAMNLGGILFGKNTYSNTGGNPTAIPLTNGQIGINVVPSAITNTLHVSATTNPVRIQGLASGSDTLFLTVDATGVMHTGSAGGGTNIYNSNGTLTGARAVNISSTTLTFSSSTTNRTTLFLSGNSVAIGTTSFDPISPEAFTISGINTTSYNILTADANVNNYTQFNLTNYSSGSSASADMIVTNNIGGETNYYTDMGINSSTFSTGIVGFANDGYVYHQGSNFWIGNTTTGTGIGNVYIFAGNSGGTIPDITISGSNGYVGIQTPTPIYNLDISGHTRATNGYLVTSAFTGPYSDGLVMDYVNAGGRIYVGANDSISFYTNYPASAATMTITSGGSVGIGVSGNNITNALHVSAATNPVRIQGLQSASDTLYLTVDATGVMHTGVAAGGGSGFTWTMNTGLTATGTNQATALALTKKVNDIATTTSGTGVVLPSATLSDYIQVTNHGLFPLLVYPAVGESVDGLTQNAPLTLLEGQSYRAACPTAGFWIGIGLGVYDAKNTSINLPVSTVLPPQTPVTGARIFVGNVGGRKMPSGIGPSGVDFPFQPHTGRSKPAWWQPLGNSTTVPITTGFAANTAMGTVTARNVATTNIATRMKRLGYVSTATSGSVAGHYFLAASQQYTLGTGPISGSVGGFHYICRFVVSDAVVATAATTFIGWRTVVTQPVSGNPSTQLNQFGLAQLSGDNSQWYFINAGGVAQTPIPLGTALGAPTATTTAWDFSIFSPPSISGNVQYTVTNLGTNVTTGGSVTITGTTAANLPVSTALLAPVAWRSPGIQNIAVGLDIGSIYVETDY